MRTSAGELVVAGGVAVVLFGGLLYMAAQPLWEGLQRVQHIELSTPDGSVLYRGSTIYEDGGEVCAQMVCRCVE